MKPRILVLFSVLFFCSSNVNALEEDTTSISANPAATNIMTGSSVLQQAVENYLGITNNHGIRIGGTWIADINELFSGGTTGSNNFSANNLIQLSLSVDGEKLMGWKGSLFDIEGLQFNGQNTNSDAGSVQGYNSLPGAPPLTRTELYQLWYRQKLFGNKLMVRIGKSVPTFNFNNVVKPVPLNEDNIPAVSGLTYTPLFVNTTLLGVLPGYYNSAYGIELTFAPIKEWYTSFAAYDGSGGQGIQTGNQGIDFNGTYFYIGETGFSWLLGENKKPGNIGIGAWHQDGLITSSDPNVFDNSASGVYLFGSQRLWYRNPGVNDCGVSGFYQYGINNADALRMKEYLGAGLTAFDLIPNRPADTLGIGFALSWLNQKLYSDRTELMFQSYYQAKILKGFYLEPVLSYIPTPGEGVDTPAAFAGTLRAVILF